MCSLAISMRLAFRAVKRFSSSGVSSFVGFLLELFCELFFASFGFGELDVLFFFEELGAFGGDVDGVVPHNINANDVGSDELAG